MNQLHLTEPSRDVTVDHPLPYAKLAYSEREAAKILGLSVRTLFNLRNTGKIAYVRVGGRIIYRAAALHQFLRANEVPVSAGTGSAGGVR